VHRRYDPPGVLTVRVTSWLALLAICMSSCSLPEDRQAAAVPAGVGGSTRERLESLGGTPCEPESEYICVDVLAPLDPARPDGDVIDLTYAVRPANRDRQGVLVVAVGGPGASGVEESSWRFNSLDRSILDHYDIVFFDQRGVGLADVLDCPTATDRNAEEWYEFPEDGDWMVAAEIEKRWVERCMDEMGRPDVIPFLSTDHAIADLELFRQTMGYDQMILYGESYGTAFAQAYAQEYPGSVERLVLDGTVDPTLNDLQDAKSLAAGLESTLALVFSACDEDPYCRADIGGPAATAYDEVMARLESGPVSASIQTGPGEWEDRSLDAEGLSSIAFSNVYFPDDRRIFLRALAAAAERDDYIPLMRLSTTDQFSGSSTVVLYGVDCLDAVIPGTDSAAEVNALETAWNQMERHSWLVQSDLACAFWPGAHHSNSVPSAFVGRGIPTMVVAATADPTTPYTQGQSVFARLSDGWMLTVSGGSHVMFGVGDQCVDGAVTDFLLGQPVDRELTCDAGVIAPYLPLIPASIDEASIEQVLEGIDNDLYLRPEWVYYYEEEDLEVGCSYGGKATFSYTDSGAAYVLDECAFTSTLVVSGEGAWDYGRGTSTMRMELAGFECPYAYRQDWESGVIRATEDC
jgi:pimeloyl-ACP methyl ester carboxylesterase